MVVTVETILIFLTSSFLYQNAKAFSSFGNQLEQYEKYVQMVETIDPSIYGRVVASDLYEAYKNCEENTIPERGFRFYNCRHDIRSQQTQARKHLWDHKRDRHHEKRYGVDCEYHTKIPTAVQFAQENGALEFSVQMMQSKCHSNFNHSKGGATIEVYAENAEVLALCRVYDMFDDSYTTKCRFPVPSVAKSVCFNMTMTVEFEHFDAFSDLGEAQFASLNHVFYKGQVCGEFKNVETSAVMGGNKIEAGNIEVSFWTRPGTSFATSYPDSNDYAWRGARPKYLTTRAMKQCLSKQTIFFCGESHMRYQFDITMDRYVDKLRVGRYHGNMNVSGISYLDMTFSARMVKFIDTIECAPTGAAVTYVLQTGSWDLQFFPPRGFISSPYQGNAVVAALRRLRERTKKCEAQVHVIYMTTMPHPWCKPSEDHCQRLMNYWRNNGAIHASNAHMKKALQALALDFKNLVVLDASAILLPRFPFEEFVCVDHFMCNNPPRGLVTTPGGMALANEVINTACSFVAPGPPNPDDFFQDGVRIIGKDSKKMFTVEQGCRREILDEETRVSMGMPLESFTVLSEEKLADYPICFRPYPSRQTYTLLQTYSSRSVFFMDGGVKRPLNGMQTLYDLKLDFDNVSFVLEEDLKVIPQGELIKTRADCKHCPPLRP